jgi:hypothetical protein
MKWFRANIKHGSRLALVALAVQFALSFGHFHGVAAQAAPALQSSPAPFAISSADRRAATEIASKGAREPASDHDSGQPSNDPCAICAVMALANAVLFATPPLLLLPQALEFSYLSTDAEFIHLDSARTAFQSRAPPVS